MLLLTLLASALSDEATAQEVRTLEVDAVGQTDQATVRETAVGFSPAIDVDFCIPDCDDPLQAAQGSGRAIGSASYGANWTYREACDEIFNSDNTIDLSCTYTVVYEALRAGVTSAELQLGSRDSEFDSTAPETRSIRFTGRLEEPEPFNSGFFEFDPTNYTVQEPVSGQTVVNLRVARRGGSDGNVTVTLSTADVSGGPVASAESGDDYESVNTTVSWNAGVDGFQTVPVPILADADREATERFVATLSNPRFSTRPPANADNGPFLGDAARASVDITDRPPPPMRGLVRFAPAAYTVDEGGRTEVTLTRTGGTDGAVSVRVTSGGGNATPGADYPAVDETVAWAAGQSGPQSFFVTAVSDSVVGENNEAFTLSIDGDDAVIGEPDQARVTINDRTVEPDPEPGIIEFRPAAYDGVEGSTVVVRAIRRGGNDGAVAVDFSSVNGTATAGADFTAVSGTLRWADEQSGEQTLRVSLSADTARERPESFSIRLTNPRAVGGEATTNGANTDDLDPTLGPAANATITIEDATAPANPGTIAFSPATYSTAEGGSVTVMAVRSGGSDGTVTVVAATANGTATAGSDYTAVSRTLRWEDGETGPQSLQLTTTTDRLVEPAETVFVNLSNPTLVGGAAGEDAPTLGAARRATVTITDDTPENGTVQFARTTQDIAESAGAVVVEVTRRGGDEGAVSVDYQTGNGTAAAGTDYTATSGTLRWPDGDDAPRRIRVPILTDGEFEPTQTFVLRLSNAEPGSDAERIGTPASITVRILNTDPQRLDAGQIGLAQTGYSVEENDESVTVTVVRSGASEGDVSIDYTTVAGSASVGQDFSARSGTLSWDDGDASARSIEIPIATDTELEEVETFTVTLDNAVVPDNADLMLGTTRSVVSIADSTEVGEPRLLADSTRVSEADGRAEVLVERTGGSDGVLRADFRTVAGTALAELDYTPMSGTLEWADGDVEPQRIEIPILTDNVVEAQESFDLVLDNVQPSRENAPTPQRATIAIDDSTPDTGSPGEEQAVFALSVVSGDNQNALPGDTLDALVLQARQNEAGAEPVENLEVNWRVLPTGAAELLDGDQTLTDGEGMTANRLRVVSRGFIAVIARVGAVRNAGGTNDLAPRINPPPVAVDELEIAFTVRSGLEAGSGLSSNQSSTGAALDSACEALDASDNALNDAQADLQMSCRRLESLLMDEGDLGAALDRLAPEELFTMGDSVIDAADIQITNVYSRINAIRSGRANGFDVAGLSLSIGDQIIPGSVLDAAAKSWGGGAAAADGSATSRLSFFANGSLSTGEVDGGDFQQEADIATQGVTLGLDYRLGLRTVIGFGLGLSNNQTEFAAEAGGVDVQTNSLTAFATWYDEDATYIDAVLDIGQNRFDVERAINLPGRPERLAIGETDADMLSLTLGIGSDLQFGSLQIGPYGRISLIESTVDAYRERADGPGEGVGALLDIREHDISSTRIAIGGQLSNTISTRSAVFVPQLRLEAEFETVDSKDGIRAVFLADPEATEFEIQGNERDSSYLNLGLGSSAIFANGRSGFLFYETQLGHDTLTQHFLKFGLRLEF